MLRATLKTSSKSLYQARILASKLRMTSSTARGLRSLYDRRLDEALNRFAKLPTYDIEAFKKLGAQYKPVGKVTTFGGGQFGGSGVYLGDGLVLTNAHVVFHTYPTYQFFDGEDSQKVAKIFRHPRYVTDDPKSVIQDLAVLVLEQDSSNKVDKLDIDYSTFDIADCIAVGFPRTFAP